jgi:hypothetical protein
MAAPLIIAAIGAAAGTYGAVKQQQAANDANEYNAQMQERNAKLADAQAQDALKRGEQDANTMRTRARSVMGQQKSALSSSGVDITSGTAQDLFSSSINTGEQDAMKVKANAAKEAWGYQMQSQNDVEQARLNRMKWVNPGETGGVSLLTHAGSMASMFGGR